MRTCPFVHSRGVTDLSTCDDGRQGFDFLFGSWQVHNRKLFDALDPCCTDWREFGATAVVRPLLGDLGNMDCYSTFEFPGSGVLDGMTLRLFNPETGTWRIWWASTRNPGDLDTPVEGRFVDEVGEFFCDDILDGRPLRVRYTWDRTDPEHPRWSQAFSYDSGTTWQTNWIMNFTRAGRFAAKESTRLS